MSGHMHVCKRVCAELHIEDQRLREAMLHVVSRLLFHRLSLYYQSYSHDEAKVRAEYAAASKGDDDDSKAAADAAKAMAAAIGVQL